MLIKNQVLTFIQKRPRTYQPRLDIFLLPTIRCRGPEAERGVRRTGCLGCGRGCSGGRWWRRRRRRRWRQHCRNTGGPKRQGTGTPATVGTRPSHPDRLYKRSNVSGWQAQPVFINWHYGTGSSFGTGHCEGERIWK